MIMDKYQQLISLRTRKLGTMIYDARLSRRRTIEECAAVILISPEEFSLLESGKLAPTLPQLEALAFYLDLPIEHFWSQEILSTREEGPGIIEKKRLMNIRNKMISARIRLTRTNLNLSFAQLAEKTGISEDNLRMSEQGDHPIALPDLEIITEALQIPLKELFDNHGPIGEWRNRQQAFNKFMELDSTLRDFICLPVNEPYLNLAHRLSGLSVEKLRLVAEALLEITY
jgi:transcriptional regulator with XRE-family HTH domain